MMFSVKVTLLDKTTHSNPYQLMAVKHLLGEAELFDGHQLPGVAAQEELEHRVETQQERLKDT
jgi:Trm5-related predicted tRNA methylase